MSNKLNTIDYFKSCLIDPRFEVFRILKDTSHNEYNNLINDLKNIDKTSLEKYIDENNISSLLSMFEDIDLESRAYYLIDLLHKEVAKERINALCDKSPRPKPYNSENLRTATIDSDNLVCIDQFHILDSGFQYNEFVYVLLPPTPQLTSNYWLTHYLVYLYKEKKYNIKIRLDPFIEKSISEYHPEFLKEYIYGVPLDWERIFNLKEEEAGQWINLEKDSEIHVTDYVWKPIDNEIHFTCEELPKENLLNYRWSRYFHTILDKETKKIKHCDGAIRIFSREEYEQRKILHIKEAECRKIGKRIKIFQINDSIDKDLLSKLAVKFFVWNTDLERYFQKN